MITALSEPAILAIIAGVTSIALSALTLIKTNSTHRIVNSRMTELLSFAKKAAKAEGVKEGERSTGHKK